MAIGGGGGSKMMIGGKCGKEKCMYTLRIKQCLCHDFNRQARIKFKSEFEKIGETGKYLGMWKLKKLCIPLLRTFIYGVCGKSFTQLQRRKEDKETHDNSYSSLEIF